ncbi:hypothetical protein CA54_40850 [Symmachiella macrocystis]|uniref:Uncharacterized protein n=1 Tax=Symmachiella macrocystis TaxID=2527985 RepID=A0A5C6BA59_9PLAN|nr:hypothetical protein [Symmachiella macrocystis]TWU08848.1 hypothetical protein CA54_40850 [Symmachiella macrocystis]
MPRTEKLTGFELAKIVASWLPHRDEQRALKIIALHERKAIISDLRELMANHTEALQRRGAAGS